MSHETKSASAALPTGWSMVYPGYAVLDGDTAGTCCELTRRERKAPHVVAWCDVRQGVQVYSETLAVPVAVVLACVRVLSGK